MKYSFIALADLHWGAMDSKLLYKHLELVLRFIQRMKDKIDFVVIAGDYFDYRLQLNSKTALIAVEWFDRLIRTCKENGVKKVRMVKGTVGHDYDQLEVFRPSYETADGYFKLYAETTSEELFPNLRCIFCPDEPMNSVEFHQVYLDQFFPVADIGFFHGNFDRILPEIEYRRIQDNNIETMVFEYAKFARLVKGPLISGHWHVATTKDSLYYIGSYDRWAFDEEEPKGFIYGEYDTDTTEYFIHRVTNPYARSYKTLIIMNESTNTPEQFSEITSSVEKLLSEDHEIRLRISYIITCENDGASTAFDTFQRRFASNSRVKITVRDLLKKEMKREKKEKTNIEGNKYEYVFDPDPHKIPSIIQRFIKDKKGVDVDISVIEKYISKYLDLK